MDLELKYMWLITMNYYMQLSYHTYYLYMIIMQLNMLIKTSISDFAVIS